MELPIIFTTNSTSFNFPRLLKEFIIQISFPFCLLIPNVNSTYRFKWGLHLDLSLLYSVVAPLAFVYMVILGCILNLSFYLAAGTFILHRLLISLKYATMADDEYDKLAYTKNLSLLARYQSQQQVMSGWIILLEEVIEWDIVETSRSIGLDPDETWFEIPKEKRREWRQWLRAVGMNPKTVLRKRYDYLADSYVTLLSVRDMALAILFSTKENDYYRSLNTMIHSVVRWILVLLPWFYEFSFERNKAASVVPYGVFLSFFVCRSFLLFLFWPIIGAFMYSGLFDFLRRYDLSLKLKDLIRMEDDVLAGSPEKLNLTQTTESLKKALKKHVVNATEQGIKQLTQVGEKVSNNNIFNPIGRQTSSDNDNRRNKDDTNNNKTVDNNNKHTRRSNKKGIGHKIAGQGKKLFQNLTTIIRSDVISVEEWTERDLKAASDPNLSTNDERFKKIFQTDRKDNIIDDSDSDEADDDDATDEDFRGGGSKYKPNRVSYYANRNIYSNEDVPDEWSTNPKPDSSLSKRISTQFVHLVTELPTSSPNNFQNPRDVKNSELESSYESMEASAAKTAAMVAEKKAEKLATTAAIPRITLNKIVNVNAWVYLRLVMQLFGKRWAMRIDTYLGAFLFIAIIAALYIMFRLIVIDQTPDEQSEFLASYLVIEITITNTIILVVTIAIVFVGAAVNYDFETHRQALALQAMRSESELAVVLRNHDDLLTEGKIFTDDEKDFYNRKVTELQEASRACNRQNEFLDISNKISPLRIMGISVDYSLAASLVTALATFATTIITTANSNQN